MHLIVKQNTSLNNLHDLYHPFIYIRSVQLYRNLVFWNVDRIICLDFVNSLIRSLIHSVDSTHFIRNKAAIFLACNTFAYSLLVGFFRINEG